MRHRMKGRKLGRNASHRKAMFRNMASSLIRTVRAEPGKEGEAKTPGRIVTTVPKAKELRPFIEKLITLAKKALPHEEAARKFETTAAKNSSEWKQWRESEEWVKWAQAKAPAVDARRRAFAQLRDKEAVEILFADLAPRFADREGGYTRILRLPNRRLGDAGEQALIEFVGERDRKKSSRPAPMVVKEEEPAAETPADESPAEDEAPTVEASAAESDESTSEAPKSGE